MLGYLYFWYKNGKLIAQYFKAKVAFTADVDGDQKADIMLEAPYANVGELEAAGLSHVVGSKSGQVMNTMYSRVKGQHLGKTLQPQLQSPP